MATLVKQNFFQNIPLWSHPACEGFHLKVENCVVPNLHGELILPVKLYLFGGCSYTFLMSGCRTVGNWYLIGEHNWELTHQCNWFRRNFDPPLRIDLSSSKLRSFPAGPAGLVFTQGWYLPRGSYLSTIKDAIKIGQLGPFRGNLQPQSDFWQICCFSPWPMDMCPIVDTSWVQWWTQSGLLPGTNG